MTPSELRAAASKLLAMSMDGSIAHDCARHILATVRDDNDEPVTQEWCELRPSDWREHMGQYINRRNSALIIANGCLCVGGKRTPITTVGQLCGILSALGIEVPQ